ncbi:MAG: YtzI protein [Bacillus sp. (in: firmicutes)]
MFTLIMVISFIIIFIVIGVTAITTTKAYQFEHKIDPNPDEMDQRKQE